MLLGYAFALEEALPHSERETLQGAHCETIFVDIINDLKETLEEREAALNELRSGYTLVVPRLSRLGRSLKELLEVVARVKEKEAHLYSVAQGLDTRKQNGRVIFDTVRALGDFNDRQAKWYADVAGRRSTSEEGKSNRGRPHALDEEDLRLAQDMLSQSVPVKQICETIGVSRATFYRYLSPDGERRNYGRSVKQDGSSFGA